MRFQNLHLLGLQCDTDLLESLSDQLWWEVSDVLLVKWFENGAHCEAVMGRKPCLDLVDELSWLRYLSVVVERPGLTNVLKGAYVLVVDDNSLLLALQDLIILFKLFVPLKYLFVGHLTANIATNLLIVLVPLKLSRDPSLSPSLVFKRLQCRLVLARQVSIFSRVLCFLWL